MQDEKAKILKPHLLSAHEPTINEALLRKSNNFDLIRLVAALMVLISHSYPLLGIGYEPFYAHLWGYDTGGGLAVAAFFVISGFLITQSSVSNSYTYFFASRIARIVPGLFGVLLFHVFVIGPFFTDLSIVKYLSESVSHLYGLLVFNLQTTLPNTFSNLPVKAINGSLWTLKIEATFYIFSAVIVFLGMGSRYFVLSIAFTFISASIFLQHQGLNWENQGPNIISSISAYNFSKLISFYLIGATIFHFKDKLKLSLPIFLVCILLLYLSRNGLIKPFIYFTAFPYCVIFLSLYFKRNFLHPKENQKFPGDVSYGVYLYAFPIQQSIISITNQELSPSQLSAIAIPITIFLGLISFHFIEKPAIKYKNLIFREKHN